MAKITFWNTLATGDLARARRFYEAIGFAVGEVPGGAGITASPGDGYLVCLFRREAFEGMVPGAVCDADRAHEIVQSLQVESREAVDAFAAKVGPAGGRLIGAPAEQPYGYATGFADPDGHVWAVLWMPTGG